MFHSCGDWISKQPSTFTSTPATPRLKQQSGGIGNRSLVLVLHFEEMAGQGESRTCLREPQCHISCIFVSKNEHLQVLSRCPAIAGSL